MDLPIYRNKNMRQIEVVVNKAEVVMCRAHILKPNSRLGKDLKGRQPTRNWGDRVVVLLSKWSRDNSSLR